MFCDTCGSKLRDNAKFCTFCGAPVLAAEAPAMASQPVDPAGAGVQRGGLGRKLPKAVLILLAILAVTGVALAAVLLWAYVIQPALVEQEPTEQVEAAAPEAGAETADVESEAAAENAEADQAAGTEPAAVTEEDSADDETDELSLYPIVCQKLINMYGAPSTEEGQYSTYLTGLTLAQLVDLDDDGTPELFTVSTTGRDASSTHHLVQIWDVRDGLTVCAYEDSPMGCVGPGLSAGTTTWNGQQWIVFPTGDGDVAYELVRLSVNGGSDIRTVRLDSNPSGGNNKIDGVTVSREDAQAMCDAIAAGASIYPVDALSSSDTRDPHTVTAATLAVLGL